MIIKHIAGGNGQLAGFISVGATEVSLPVGVTPIDITSTISGFYGSSVLILGDNNQIYGFGQNGYGQLGAGYENPGVWDTYTNGLVLTTMPSGVNAVSVKNGLASACFLSDTSRLYCWGRYAAGNGNLSSTVPVEVSLPAGLTVIDYDVADHVCAIMSDNQTYCWGYSNDGSMGRGSANTKSLPETVIETNLETGEYFIDIEVSSRMSCAKTNQDRTYCWGEGGNGGIGDGYNSDRPYPVFPVRDTAL